jgi:hypothetical protein
MRKSLLAVAASAALLAACSPRTEDGGPTDTAVPEFGTDDQVDEGVVGEGDVARVPPAVDESALSIDGQNVPLTQGSCISTGVPIEGVSGYQAGLADDEGGQIEAEIDAATGTARATITRPDEVRELDEMSAEIVNNLWDLRYPPEADLPDVQLVFDCPEVDEVGPTTNGRPQDEGLGD